MKYANFLVFFSIVQERMLTDRSHNFKLKQNFYIYIVMIGQTNKQSNRDSTLYIYQLRSQRRDALHKVLIVTPDVYPHLYDFTGKLTFRYKIRPTQLKISKPSYRTFPWFSRGPQSKFEANRFLSYDRTNKQRF